MITYSTECSRCGWAIGPGEVICSKCGVQATPSETTPRADHRTGDNSIAAAFDAELLARLRQAVLGDYHILGELGRGGMCVVYLAHDLTLDRRVAIKVLLPSHVTGHGVAERRLHQEARTAASLVHPNIIPVHAVRYAEGLVYLVLHYVEGRALDGVLRQVGRLPWQVVQTTLVQVGSALEYAHKRGVIHRDIKPGNIIVGNDGVVVLADFGIAKVTDAPDITGTGASIGTPCYMSPELCSGEPATAAADQYALGVVAYEMLTGKPPFWGDSIAAVVTQHLFEKPRPIENVAPDCPQDLRRTVYRMLEKSPERRWASIKEALKAFGGPGLAETEPGQALMADLLEGIPAEAAPGSGVSTPRSPVYFRASRPQAPPESKPSFTQVTFGIVLAVAVVFVLLLQRRPEPVVTSTAPADTQFIEAIISGQPTGADVPIGEPGESPLSPAPSTDSVTVPRENANASDTAIEAPLDGPPDAVRDTPRLSPTPNVVPTRSTAVAGPQTGNVVLGTRGLTAVLFVDGQPRGVIDRLDSWPVPAGSVRLSIRQDGCSPWDSTITVDPGGTVRVGYRRPACAP